MPTPNVMLAALSISLWQARKYDKRVSKEVADNHGTDIRVGRYTKRLAPADWPSYKALRDIASEARQLHYEMTMRWSLEGCRLLTEANHPAYDEKMAELERRFDDAIPLFAADFPELREAAKEKLNGSVAEGGLFDEADYPSDIASCFVFQRAILPLPLGEHLQVNIRGAEETRAAIDQAVNTALDGAYTDLWERVFTAVSHAAERLGQPDAVFRDSLIGNLGELVELLPRLNFRRDAGLETARREIQERLASLDPQSLRDDPELRAQAAIAATTIATTAGRRLRKLSDLQRPPTGNSGEASAPAENATNGQPQALESEVAPVPAVVASPESAPAVLFA